MRQTYQFANIAVSAEFSESYIEEQCKEYRTELPAVTEIKITRQDIEYERAIASKDSAKSSLISEGYLESVSLFRNLTRKLSFYDVVLIHASAVMFDNSAYLYIAPSGVGKSTHARLCKQAFKERVEIINDDKPFLRKENGQFTVYGNPWDGKHHLSRNIRANLGGLCFLTRGACNTVSSLSFRDALPGLISQTYISENEKEAEKIMSVLCSLSDIKIWSLTCNTDIEAAFLSLNTMKGM